MGESVRQERDRFHAEQKSLSNIFGDAGVNAQKGRVQGQAERFGLDLGTVHQLAISGQFANFQQFEAKLREISENIAFQSNPTRAAGQGSSLSTPAALRNLAAGQAGLRRSTARPGFFFDPKDGGKQRRGVGTFLLPRPGLAATKLSKLDEDEFTFR